MPKPPPIPCALTIAGSDSGGGAGVQADLRTFAAFGVHGLTAITCLTAQSPRDVTRIEPVKPSMIQAQIESALTTFRPRAVKIGMLYSAGAVRAVAACLKRLKRMNLIVDPVLTASSGAALLQRAAKRPFMTDLLPLATLVTPNIPEAETLTGVKIREPEDMRRAARALHDRTGRAILLKGGHGREERTSVDVFFDGREEFLLTLPRLPLPERGVHGTGCVLSAAITACLARGDALLDAIQSAKEFTTQAIAQHHLAHGHRVLGFEPGRPANKPSPRPR